MKKKGFTLIELLVVIAIIGILSSVVVVSLNSARAKARDAKRVADLGEIKTALGLWFDSFQEYPETLAELASNPQFLTSVPTGPNPSEAYIYVPSADGFSYHLGATLEQVPVTTGVLASDRDCTTAEAATEGFCTGFEAGVVGGFAGADVAGTGCGNTGAPTGATIACYDVTP